MGDAGVRERVFDAIRAEYDRACDGIRLITGDDDLARRFPKHRVRFKRVRDDLDRVNLLQVELPREARAGNRTSPISIPLLQSMIPISTGLGWTG